jgi:hypothetical protein
MYSLDLKDSIWLVGISLLAILIMLARLNSQNYKELLVAGINSFWHILLALFLVYFLTPQIPSPIADPALYKIALAALWGMFLSLRFILPAWLTIMALQFFINKRIINPKIKTTLHAVIALGAAIIIAILTQNMCKAVTILCHI